MNILYVFENISELNKNVGHYIHNNKTMDALRNKGHKVFSPLDKSLDSPFNLEIKRDLYQKLKKWYPKSFGQLCRNIYDIYFDKFLYRKRLISYLKNQSVDVIYERLTYFHSAASNVARTYRLPYVLEIHSPLSVLPVDSWKRTAKNIYLKIAHMADAIIVVSGILRKELQRYGVLSDKIHIIPNAADEDLINSIDENQIYNLRKKYGLQNKIVIGFVGSMAPYHGVDFLIEAAAVLQKLYKRINRLKYILIGSFRNEQEKNQIRKLISIHNLNSQFILIGSVRHEAINNYIEIIDICVLPSCNNWYGSPIKLFEYGIMKKAIVASRFLPIEEIFEENKNILLFEPEKIDDFVSKIIKLIEDPIQRKKLGEEAHRKIINFHTWNKNAEKIINVFKDVILKKKDKFKARN